jgi:GT2 family glycosyltransferase/SAM-dependent methyltransferase
MTAAPQVAVIIPNWNGEAVLGECLRGVECAARGAAVEVIVYDNGSTDGSHAVLASWGERLPLTVIHGSENVGFAEACNRGFARSRAPLLLFLNSDAFLRGQLSTAVDYMNCHPDVGIVQGPLLTSDGAHVDSVGSMMTVSGFLLHPLHAASLDGELPPSRDVFSVKGAAMYVRRAVVDEIGLFPADAFAYWEETDLCWRARLMGWRVRYSSTLPVALHVGGHAAHQLPSRVSEFHSFKNRLRSILTNAGGWTLTRMLPLHAGISAGAVCAAIASGRVDGAGAVASAYAWNIRALPETRRRRRQLQRARVRSDAAVFAGVMEPVRPGDFLRLGVLYQRGKRRGFVEPARDRALLRRLASDWEEMAAIDPLWAVLSDADRRGGRWEAGEFFATGRREVAHLLGRAEALARPASRRSALDLGCGVGRLTAALGGRFETVTGVDISPRMVELAESLAGGLPGISFHANQRQDLSMFGDEQFDLVLCSLVLQHLPNHAMVRRYIAEMLRVLRPDGLLYVQMPHRLTLLYRVFARRRPFLALRSVGVSPRWMQSRLGLHSMRMIAMSETDVRECIRASGGVLLDVEHHPDEGRRYYVTRGPHP